MSISRLNSKLSAKLLVALFLSPTVLPISSEAASLCEAAFRSAVAPALSFNQAPQDSEGIYLREKIGKVEEHSIRQGSTAAHIYLDSSVQPYFFVAFPEGNSGTGLWLESTSGAANLEATSNAKAIEGQNGLHGTEIDLKTGSKSLVMTDALLGSMRFIRDRELGIQAPDIVHNHEVKIENGVLVLTRKSINGLAEYKMQIIPKPGTRIAMRASKVTFTSQSEVQFTLQAVTSEKPLTPMKLSEVFTPEALARISPAKLQAFSFLLYKEKLMAGSPRYFSKFGRDSIYTLRVLMEHMKPEAIEALLNATISSMDPVKGLVSHEQHEGDFASYERAKAGEPVQGVNKAIEDYKMIDDDYAFTFVLGQYIKKYPERTTEFFRGRDQRGISRHILVQKLFLHVAKSTRAFAVNPIATNLVGLHEGEPTGQWRDSENGLGRGKYAFDVNAAFIPAALKTLRDLYRDTRTNFHNPTLAIQMNDAFIVWNTKVTPLFEVRVTPEQALKAGSRYFQRLGIDPSQLPATPTEDLVFSAISLDEKGKPVRIMHSDDSLMMTFGYPSKEFLATVPQRIDNQFPYGLTTPVGVLVANPVFTPAAMQNLFDETKYHGRVSWTMQEDLLVYGIDRQLQRTDLPQELRDRLVHSKQEVEKVIRSKSAMGGTEVFSISYQNGEWVAAPFAGDAKSNSNQLWSHLRMVGGH